jgi:hypothetical protein
MIFKILYYQYGRRNNFRTGCLVVLRHVYFNFIILLWRGIALSRIRLVCLGSFLNSSGTCHSTPVRGFVRNVTGLTSRRKEIVQSEEVTHFL